MATAFPSFRPSGDFVRSAVDTVLGAAGTRVALRALRRYPKTAIALGVVAAASALVGGVLHNRSETSQEDKPRRKPRRKAKPATS